MNTDQAKAHCASTSQLIPPMPAQSRKAFSTPSRCRIHFQISATTTGESSTGKEEHRPEKAARADVAVQDDGGQQREADHEADLQRHEPQRVPDRAPELVLAAGIRVEVAAAIVSVAKFLRPTPGRSASSTLLPPVVA
jgi:hypothetical protein